MANRKRVVITGMGCVTPLGNNMKDTWHALGEGRSGIGYITIFDAETFATKIAGEIKNFDFDRWTKKDKSLTVLGRNSQFALEAASEAMQGAGLLNKSSVSPERLGIYFGAGDGGCDLVEYGAVVTQSADKDGTTVDPKIYFKKNIEIINSKKHLEQEPYQVLNHLAKVFNVQGPTFNCLTACAASSQAIGEAVEVIRRGDADVMISGGTHSMIHPLGVAGFILLTALSTRNNEPAKASRPFDKDRDGFVLSEGAGVLILEELEHATKRGATIHAELIGYGASADAFRLTDPHPDGRGAIQAIRQAIVDANIKDSEIDYINAHGTSTQLNDEIETLAIKQVFGEKAKTLPVSSIKSMLGHMIAAAGAVELISSIQTIKEGIIPPTINYQTQDEICDLDYVPNKARQQKTKTVLSNSFGFGGQNIALIVREFHK
jgi:3-oxoacyl-[acyl-carrier-protein] synthase II